MLNLASRARPYLGAVILTVGLLTAGGIYSATRMPSGVYPEVTFPRIAVVAKVPALPVANMEVLVTRPLEQAVMTVLGVAQVRSKTIRGGSELSVDFNPGTDMRRAEQLTWNRIGAIRSQLPPDTELTVEQMTPSVFPILSLVLVGGDSPAQLRDYAFYQLAPQIKNVPDVLYANVAGGDIREIEVVAHPDALLAAGLSAADLADEIGKVHRLQPVGRIEGQPLAFQLLVNTTSEKARQVEELVVSTKNNQPMRVADLADVRVLHQDRVLSIGYEGKDAVVITVFRRLGGNTVNISRNLEALLAKQPPPSNIHAQVVYDQARFVNTAVFNVRDAIIVGGIFSVLILLGFLRSVRATLIAAVAIPITLAITLLFLYWSGETLNLMSLGGLAVAIGLIIDDTVVVIENIARHLAPASRIEDRGSRIENRPLAPPTTASPSSILDPRSSILDPRSSILDPRPSADPVDAASAEITGAVIGSTLTTVLVFVPLAFITGVYGQFFASLSWSLSIAVLVSMVISLTLVPVCAARFLAGKPMPEPGPIYRALAHVYEVVLGALLFLVESVVGPIMRLAEWVLGWVLGPTLSKFVVRGLVLLFIALPPLALIAVLYTGIPDPYAQQEEGKPPPPPLVKGLETGLMPAMDEGAFVLDYWAPSGTPLERTEEMARELEKILSKNPDVDSYVRRTGAELGIFATQTSRGDIQVVLRPAEEDPISLATKPVRPDIKEIEAELNKDGKEAIRQKYRRRPLRKIMNELEDEIFDSFAEHQLKFELVQVMQDELNDLSGANKPVEVKLFGPDHDVLRRTADQVAEVLAKNGKGRGVKEVNSNVREGNPDLMIAIKGDQAARLGLAADAVERQLKAMFLGQTATQVRESAARITDVRVRYPDSIRFGNGRFDPGRLLDQWILLPDPTTPAPPSSSTPWPTLTGPARSVALSAVADIKPVRTPDEQWRENNQPAIFVTAELNEEEAGLGSVVADIRRSMASIPMPSPAYHWELGGHYLRQQEAFWSLFGVMIVAIVLVFIMLAFQFRSVVLPFLIFLTQPLSVVSGLFALWITGTPLNVSSYMGIILLIGLDMKNGILLVEYIQQLLAEGMALRPALLLAGRTRFRPILMTSLAAILGLFPLALGIGPGSQMQQPLAILVIGGLTANMLFTRMVIPVGYLVLEGKKEAVHR
jgi:multidrug efflux pump subunit AcrB